MMANSFAPDDEPKRVCRGCGEKYDHPDPAQHVCAQCECGGETCQWRIVRSTTLPDGTTGGQMACFTPGCGKRKDFVE